MTSDTRWLTEREQRAWRGLLQMHARLNAHLGRHLQATSELSLADFEVLVALTDVPDARRRVLELGRDLQWEKSRLSHHLTRMEKRGLVARQECPSDRRGAFVVVTPAGRAAIEAAAPAHVAEVRRLVFDLLDDREVGLLGDVTQRVAEQLEAVPSGGAVGSSDDCGAPPTGRARRRAS